MVDLYLSGSLETQPLLDMKMNTPYPKQLIVDMNKNTARGLKTKNCWKTKLISMSYWKTKM